MAKFIADFDRVGIALSIASLLILLYFGLTVESFAKNYWVAYAFWIAGFLGSNLLGLTRRSVKVSLKSVLGIFIASAFIILIFTGVNFAYAHTQDVWNAERLGSVGVGIAEELFFGVFILGLLINWLNVPRLLAVLATAIGHACYHIPQWGFDPGVITVFFICFTIARAVYVFFLPKVGVLLLAHGGWNWLVSPGQVFHKVLVAVGVR
jgi:hypothetical protein